MIMALADVQHIVVPILVEHVPGVFGIAFDAADAEAVKTGVSTRLGN